MATVSMSMATQLSDLDDEKTGVNIQTEGHTLTLPSSQNGPEDTEAFGNASSHSPSWSLVRKLIPDCPETWYCLEIQVICTEDWGMTPPPPHVWQVPVVEDMVWDGKSGLTEAVVTSPNQAVLFYGQRLLGEGLSLAETQDTAFTLSGAIYWVGKQAQLNANPISLGEGQWLIAQAITDWCIEPRGPRHPCSIPPASAPFNFSNQGPVSVSSKAPTPLEWWGTQAWPQAIIPGMRPSITERPRPRAMRTMGRPTPATFTLPRSWVWEVIEAQHQLLHQCHQGPIDLEALGICTGADNVAGSQEPTWKSVCQFSRMRTWKMLSPTKGGTGT